MAYHSFFPDMYFTYFDLLFFASSLPTVIFSQWYHSSFQTPAEKWFITHLWSGGISGRFIQLVHKHLLNQHPQPSPRPEEVVATKQMLLISINNSAAP